MSDGANGSNGSGAERAWPDWPVTMRGPWVLVTPIYAAGWPAIGRVQRVGEEAARASYAAGDVVLLPGDTPIQALCGMAVAVLPYQGLMGVVHRLPPGAREHVLVEEIVAQAQRAAVQAQPRILRPA